MARLTARYKEVGRWTTRQNGQLGWLVEWEQFEVSLREEGKVLVRVRTKYNPAHKPDGQVRSIRTTGWQLDSETTKSLDEFGADLEAMGFTRLEGSNNGNEESED
jgi:hypothetical protein